MSEQEAKYEGIMEEVRVLIKRHTATAPNDVMAAIAIEAYTDACDAWDIPASRSRFADHFPTLAEYI